MSPTMCYHCMRSQLYFLSAPNMDIFNPFPKLGNYDHPCKEVIRRGQGTYPLLLAIVLQDGPISLPLSISLLHEVFELKATLQMNPIVCNKGAPSRMGDTHVIIALEWCDYVVARHHACECRLHTRADFELSITSTLPLS